DIQYNPQYQQLAPPPPPLPQAPPLPPPVPQAPPPPPPDTPPPPPPPLSPQVVVQPSNQYAEPIPVIPVDATTRATTLPSESYVEAEPPEGSQNEAPDTNFNFYENQPNNGYRQPVRRALASATGSKPEVFTDKCNDERLKKIIEEATGRKKC
ncbi:unnamed protein product, partial [Strongylus vulgaris]